MSDTTDTWLTIEQAAVALKLSVRTVNRHISAAKLQSRLADGRREVLVPLPGDPPELVSPPPPTPMSDADRLADGEEIEPQSIPSPSHHASRAEPDRNDEHDRQSPHPTTTRQTMMVVADRAEKAQMALAAYQTVARMAETQLNAARRGSRVAWSSVAVMAACIIVAVGWTSHQLTQAQADTKHLESTLSDRVTELKDTKSQMSAQIERVQADKDAALASAQREMDQRRTAEATAREQVARLQGQFANLWDVQNRQPATRPTSFLSRLLGPD